jgi:hypothetical protein
MKSSQHLTRPGARGDSAVLRDLGCGLLLIGCAILPAAIGDEEPPGPFAVASAMSNYLAKVELIVTLAREPAENEGQIYVSVFPDTVPESSWRQSPAEYRDGLSLQSIALEKPAPGELKVRRIPPLFPGHYWVKAVWNRTPPFQFNLMSYEGMREWKETASDAPGAAVDDFESGEAEVFEVKAGETTTAHVHCTQPGSYGH